MDLLAFARGPGMHWAMIVFAAGILWRVIGVLLLRGRSELSEPRSASQWKGLRLIGLRSWPRKEFLGGTAFGEIMGYTFHIGFLVALFFYLPHILFFEDVAKTVIGVNFRRVFGFDWPYLPGGAIYFFSAVSVAALIAVLVHRIASPVKRMLSNFDDYFSWFVTIAPIATGMLAYSHFAAPYPMMLALHLLSVELLMVWFPFGKLMHAFWMFAARGIQGVEFERKGASL
ncbi:MAG TPA: nitrate reductase [Burkholderiales bacterium]|nr:nitrate reductase [Burkholderiales bacterium]